MTVKETLISSQEQPKPWVETPLKESYGLSRMAGCRVFLKLENLQPSGSFKSRGVGNFILRSLEKQPAGSPPPHIFSSSGGNAGLAAVHASRTLGLECTVIVPTSTKPHMIELLKTAGAHEVVQHGPTWADADKYLRTEAMVKHPGPAVYCPPFDHPDVWEGNSTLIHETVSQLPPDCAPPSAVICSVGGGGLLNGICQGISSEACPWPNDTPIIAAETLGADSLSQSMAAGELITLPAITSQATSLGAVRVSEQTFAYAMGKTNPAVKVIPITMPDAAAAAGCFMLAEEERMLTELACGVSVKALSMWPSDLKRRTARKVGKEDVVVLVVCGGSNVSVDMMAKWKEEFHL